MCYELVWVLVCFVSGLLRVCLGACFGGVGLFGGPYMRLWGWLEGFGVMLARVLVGFRGYVCC